jgi:hypothetical protein
LRRDRDGLAVAATSAGQQTHPRRRTLNASKRIKRVAIVALARKLIVALWRYLTTGLVPEGAMLKTAEV